MMKMIRFAFYMTSFLIACGYAISQHNDYYYGPPPSLKETKNIPTYGAISPKENSKGIPNQKIKRGKQLFKANCATCHNKNMKTDMTGPALGGVTARWAAFPREDLYNWIRNSQKMIAERHPKAVDLWKDWQPTIMNSYPQMSDEDIDAILVYIEM